MQSRPTVLCSSRCNVLPAFSLQFSIKHFITCFCLYTVVRYKVVYRRGSHERGLIGDSSGGFSAPCDVTNYIPSGSGRLSVPAGHRRRGWLWRWTPKTSIEIITDVGNSSRGSILKAKLVRKFKSSGEKRKKRSCIVRGGIRRIFPEKNFSHLISYRSLRKPLKFFPSSKPSIAILGETDCLVDKKIYCHNAPHYSISS